MGSSRHSHGRLLGRSLWSPLGIRTRLYRRGCSCWGPFRWSLGCPRSHLAPLSGGGPKWGNLHGKAMSISAIASSDAAASVSQVIARVQELQSHIASLGSKSSGASFASTLNNVSRTASTSNVTVGQAGTAPSGVDVDQFAQDILRGIQAPVTAENVRVMRAWVRAEGTSAKFNPLATIQGAPGATSMNSVGVKNYTSYQQGVQSTLTALTNGLYSPIIASLRRGDDALTTADAIASSPWGSGGLVKQILQSEAR